jgi:glycosyltransferase involved in cell wall biosynthesis
VSPKRLAAVISHPVQYYAPVFRELAHNTDLHVYYGRRFSQEHAQAGFGVAFEWDNDLFSGYEHSYLCDGAFETFAAELRQAQFDALLVMGWYQPVLRQAILAAKRAGVPVIVRGDSHLGVPRGPLKRAAQSVAYPSLLRLLDAAAYVGKRSRDYFSHFCYPQEQLFHSPHCVDTEWFKARATPYARADLRQRLAVSSTTRLVLFAGKLMPFKRPLDALEAVSSLRRRGVDIELVVAGAGELEGAVRARGIELGLRVHMLGFQNQSQMPGVFAASDALVLPSARETWGLVCNEALASNVPIVVSDAVGCAPDLAADNHVGRIYPCGNVDSCAAALASLLHQPPARADIAAVSERFSLAAGVSGILDALAFVTAGTASRPSEKPHAHSS